MIRALTAAATGLEAQQSKIENIANDLANVNTDSYKRNNTEFHDLMYETVKAPGSTLGTSSQSPVGVQYGTGVKVGASHKIFELGPPKITNNPLDIMIEGPGFFQVQTPQGESVYTRNGAFHRDSQGLLTLSNGNHMNPPILVPNNATNILISHTGEVVAQFHGAGDAIIGQIQLVTFQNEQGLIASGEGTYRPSSASGAPVPGIPGENGAGTLQQGQIEASNVNVANSMVDMISAQRAYEMGTKVMGAVDQMLGATVNIK